MASYGTKTDLRNPLLSSKSLSLSASPSSTTRPNLTASSSIDMPNLTSSSLLTKSSLTLQSTQGSLITGRSSSYLSSSLLTQSPKTSLIKSSSLPQKDSQIGTSSGLISRQSSLGPMNTIATSTLSSYFPAKSYSLSTSSQFSTSSLYSFAYSKPLAGANIKLSDTIEEDSVPFFGCPSHELPKYVLDKIGMEKEVITSLSFPSPHVDRVLSLAGQDSGGKINATTAKRMLLHAMASALIGGPNYKNPGDLARLTLMHIASRVIYYDPEFLLKTVLYSRQELNLRTPSNFLMAFASCVISCRPYLKIYYNKCIRLPSDWIEVAELYQTLCDSSIKFKSLPTALRKVMVNKFSEFDNHQLAKYNKDKDKARKKREKLAAEKKKREDKKKPPATTTTTTATTATTTATAPKKTATPKKDTKIPTSATKADKIPRASKTRETLRLLFSSDSESSTDTESESDISDSDTDDSDAWDSEGEWNKIQLDDNYSVSVDEMMKLNFTLKQLIRKLHISRPVEPVLSLLGKRYPEDPESFRRTGMLGIWDETRAGKRMRLPVPETWETQISMKGNKAKVWEDLVDHRKLPFMAMLRNIRNLLLAGVQPRIHGWVIKQLNDTYAVTNSKQFPFRFFSAYQVIAEVEKKKEEINHNRNQSVNIRTKDYLPSSTSSSATRGGRGRGRGRVTRGPTQVQIDKADKQFWKDVEVYDRVEVDQLTRYRDALDNAVKIATKSNVQPIPGVTIVLCNASIALDKPCTGFKGMGQPRTIREVGLLLGLMCKYACEDCSLLAFATDYRECEVKEGTILHNLTLIMNNLRGYNLDLDNNTSTLPISYLNNFLKDHTQIDNLIILSDKLDFASEDGLKIKSFLHKYRHYVNPDLLFVSVDLSGTKLMVDSSMQPENENDIFLAGFSDQILRFIAQRGDSAQLTHVENINLKYVLKDTAEKPKVVLNVDNNSLKQKLKKVPALPVPMSIKWRSCRVFISSTFLDMHGERDMLTRFVFPELRARAEKRKVHIYEIDLRWGVTKHETESRRSLELCLAEASRCDLFIGILGERYGWVPRKEDFKKLSEEYKWALSLEGASVTELEFYAAALNNPSTKQGKAFFYFRNSQNLKENIDANFKSKFFAEEDGNEQTRLKHLKDKVKVSSLEVFSNFPCSWGGVIGGVPVASDLTEFGNRVLANIWSAIDKLYPEIKQEKQIDPSQEHDDFISAISEGFIGRKNILKELLRLCTIDRPHSGLLLINGQSGCGKSSLLCQLSRQLVAKFSIRHVISHICGAAPGSTNIVSILIRLYAEIMRRVDINVDVPQEYQELVTGLPDIFIQASKRISGGVPLIILIDGLDLLEDNYQACTLDWIPPVIPDNILLVATVVEGGVIESACQKRVSKPESLKIKGLNPFEKEDLVKSILSRFKKKLDEGAFSGEMKVLLSKKQSDNPLFLALVCEELRVFGVFEKVAERIKKVSQTLPNLLQEILLRLEEDHSRDVMVQALCLIICSRGGLNERELGDLIQPRLPQAKLQPLMRALTDFINNAENSQGKSDESEYLSLTQIEIKKAIKLRYMKTSNIEIEYHIRLHEYFLTRIDPENNSTWSGTYTRAFRDIGYHLNKAGAYANTASLLTDLTYIEAKCKIGHSVILLEDFQPPVLTQSKTSIREFNKFMQTTIARDYQQFISSNLHIISGFPGLILQQALNSPFVSVKAAGEKLIAKRRAHGQRVDPLALWLNRPDREVQSCLTLMQQSDMTNCISVSQDGSFLACGTDDCIVKVYNVHDGKEVKTFIGHSGPICSVCFAGNKKLCSASEDNTLCLWDLDKGHRISVLKHHSKRVTQCVSDSKGKQILSSSWDCTAVVWNAEKGNKIAELKVAARPLSCTAFHPDGQLAVFGGWDNIVRMWDTFHQKKIKIMKGHTSAIRAVCYAPSGRHVVSAALNGEVKIWSTRAGTQVGSIMGHCLPLTCLSYSTNGQFLITGSEDCKAKIWSGLIGKPSLIIPNSEGGYVLSVKFSPCGQYVLAGYHNGLLIKYNTGDGSVEVQFENTQFSVNCVAWSPANSEHCIAGYDDGLVIAYNAETGKALRHLKSHTQAVTCMDWNQHHVATGSADFTICLWPSSVQGGKKIKTETIHPDCQLKGHTATVKGVSFSPDGIRLASVGQDCSLILWDTLNYTQMNIVYSCHKDWVNCCSYSDLGDFMITGSQDFNLKMWNMKDLTEKGSFVGHTTSVNHVVFTTGVVASASLDGTIKIWTHRGVEITTLHCHNQRINSCDIYLAKSGRHTRVHSSWEDDELEDTDDPKIKKANIKLEDIQLATASDDGTIQIWQPFVSNEICAITGHRDRVLSVATSQNNEFITSSRDHQVKFWRPDLKPEEPHPKLQCHNGPITSISISPSGDNVLMTSRDNTITMWNLTDSDKTYIMDKLYTLSGHSRCATTCCYCTDSLFCTGGEDSKVICWTYRTKKKIPKRSASAENITHGSVTSIAYLIKNNQGYIAVSYWSGKLIIYDVSTLNNTKLTQCSLIDVGFTDWVMSMHAISNDKLLVACMDKQFAEVYSDGSCKLLSQDITKCFQQADTLIAKGRTPKYPLKLFPTCLAVYNTMYLAGDSEGRLVVFKSSGEDLNMYKLHAKRITALLVKHNLLVSTSMDGIAKFWHLAIKDKAFEIEQVGEFYCKSPILSAELKFSKTKETIVIVADQYGHVNIIKWY